MLALRLTELMIGSIAVILLVTQIIVPGLRGTKFFPLLSPKRREIEAAVIEANEQEDIENMTPKSSEKSVKKEEST